MIPLHDRPKFLKKINYKDANTVKKTMHNFEKRVMLDIKENACVILIDGSVYECSGANDRIYPDYDFGKKLKNASVTHNHPISETQYSFSNDDLSLFMDYELEILRGCDGKYTYELTRNADDVDVAPENWKTPENYRHAYMIMIAKKYGIGYRRWKNE